MKKLHVTVTVDAPGSVNDVERFIDDVKAALESSPHMLAHREGVLVGLVGHASSDGGLAEDCHRRAFRVPSR